MPDTARRILKAGLESQLIGMSSAWNEAGTVWMVQPVIPAKHSLINASHRSTAQRHPSRTLPEPPKAADVSVPDPQRVLSSHELLNS